VDDIVMMYDVLVDIGKAGFGMLGQTLVVPAVAVGVEI
jgi:hypothetical protein